MASEKVIIALEQLYKELEKLKPAIRHTEIATKVTEDISSLPQKYIELLDKIRQDEVRLKNELVENVATELKRTTAFKQELMLVVEKEAKAISNGSNRIQQTVEELLTRIQKADVRFKDTLNNALLTEVAKTATFKQELTKSLKEEAKHLRDQTTQTQQAAQAVISNLAESQNQLERLREEVQSFFDSLSPLNLPKRFDTLDNGFSVLKETVRQLDDRFADIDRIIGERISELAAHQTVALQGISDALSRTLQERMTTLEKTVAALVEDTAQKQTIALNRIEGNVSQKVHEILNEQIKVMASDFERKSNALQTALDKKLDELQKAQLAASKQQKMWIIITGVLLALLVILGRVF